MIDGEFSNKILDYLKAGGKRLDPALLAEAGARARGSFQRQLMEERMVKPGTLRMSSGGHCARKQWYVYTGAEGEPFSPRTMITFLTGDLIEVGLSILGRLAGWQLSGKPEDGSDTLGISIPTTTVTGHLDDLLYVPGENRYYVVEYKSMSEYSYREFESNGLDDTWGYATQCSLYCHAMKVESAIMLAEDKNTGHICDRVIPRSDELVEKAIAKWNAIIAGRTPEREFVPEAETVYNRKTKQRDPTGRMILPINCAYCQFKETCWSGQIETEIVSGKPKFYLKENV